MRELLWRIREWVQWLGSFSLREPRVPEPEAEPVTMRDRVGDIEERTTMPLWAGLSEAVRRDLARREFQDRMSSGVLAKGRTALATKGWWTV